MSKLSKAITSAAVTFREWKMQREKVDFLMAVGEKLCRLSGTESTEHLARVRSGDSQEPAASERRWDDAPEEYIAILADMVGFQ